MEHYWGRQAIAERLGYRNAKSFDRAYRQGRVFAYKRRDPRDPRRTLWYSNSQLMAQCEFALHRVQWEEFRAKQRANDPHQ